MATFKENLNKEFRESLRDRFESNTGIFGQALRSQRENEEKAKKAQAQAERINTTTGKLRSTSAALSSMEASFIQMSKNMRLIAEAMGAEVSLQEETDKDRKKLDEIAKKRLALQQEISSKKQKDLSKLNKRVNESINQQKDNKSIFEKILDVLDDLPGGKRGGRGGRGGGGRGRTPNQPQRTPPGQPQRTPPAGPPSGPSSQPQRTPPAGQQPRVPTGGTPPRTPPRIPSRLPPGVARLAAREAAKLAARAVVNPYVILGTGAIAGGYVARETKLGERLAQGQGGAAQAALRQRDTQYGADITPESARAILDQPDSPGKRRDIQAFGGKDRLENLAKQARQQTPTPTRQQIYGQAAGRQQQTSSQAAVTSDGGAAFRRSERAYAGTQAAPARNVQENVFTGPMTATRQRDVQENVFTGPMTPAARPATQQRPAAAQPTAAPRPAAAQPAVSPGSTIADKKTDDQGSKNPSAGDDATPKRKEASIPRPKNVTLGPRTDLSQGYANQGLIQRVYLAAQKYGKPITITSGFRSDAYQALLYVKGLGGERSTKAQRDARPKDWPDPEPKIYIPSLPKTNQKVLWKDRDGKPRYYDIKGSGKHNAHLEMSEIDISPGSADPEWTKILREHGVHFPWPVDDPPHARILNNAPSIESLGGVTPSNVVTSGDGTPVTTGSGGFVTSGTPAAPAPAAAPARPAAQPQAQNRPSVAASIPPGQLGKVAEKYETGGRGSGIVGWDSTGGTSYGKYQIASKVGAMTSFLKFIEGKGHRELAAKLRASGIEKDTGSNTGRPVDVWKQVVAAGELGNLEHLFIKERSYDPALRAIKDPQLKNLINSNRGLQEMLWSTAVQHGPGGAPAILNAVYTPGMSVDELIQKVYAARGTKFGASTEKVQRAVLNRFQNEQKDITAILAQSLPAVDTNNYGNQPTTIVVQNNNNTTVRKPGGTTVAGQTMALVGA